MFNWFLYEYFLLGLNLFSVSTILFMTFSSILIIVCGLCNLDRKLKNYSDLRFIGKRNETSQIIECFSKSLKEINKNIFLHF